MLTCEFSNPVKADGTPTNNNTNPWNFKNLTCSGSLDLNSTSTSSNSALPVYISTTTGDFYIQKTFTFGELMLLALLIPVIFIITAFGIRQLLIHKFLN